MIRSHYFNYIEDRLSHLATRIEMRGKLNYLDLHLQAENFYLHFFNELFGWQLQNLNAIKPNADAIDLIDYTNKIVSQVSATATKMKVESALSKDLSLYTGYNFKFISISKDSKSLRGKSFANPFNLTFDPKADIYDVASILKFICGLDTDEQRRIFVFIKKELGSEADPQRLESNLATIINILAKENWNRKASSVETIPFGIDDKIDHNDLDVSRSIIDDYKVHHNRVDRIYSEFDLIGNNKSTSVLDATRRDYLSNKAHLSGDDLFFKIVECVVERVKNSTNYKPIPYEELELCVNILVVDAFIRCKIFNNPIRHANAAS
ncbi:MAG: SMEK domain-containing protein [Desulfocapsaceae bacterium]|nr:SMEK domain-containing protein [Desulfocapsaceae bacterium]